MRIDYLADKPELAAGLIAPMVKHWRAFIPEENDVSRAEKFRRHMNRDSLPIAWIAYEGESVFGTAALREHDLEHRTDLTPWLAGVHVLPEYRGRGIATALCRVVEAKAREMGYARLYLITLDRQSLYAQLGWHPFEPSTWRGYPVDIMSKNL